MHGTFKPGDCLWMGTTAFSEICKGDVVIFQRVKFKELVAVKNNLHAAELSEIHTLEESTAIEEIVHRVINIKAEGLLTRGDNNYRVDPDPVTEENFVGLVTQLERSGIQKPVRNGWMGSLRADFLRIWKFYLRRVIAQVVRPPYRWLAHTDWATRLWHPVISTYHFHNTDGEVYKFITNGRIIARWWPSLNHFECQKPYDLVLQRKYLPR